MDLLGLVAGGQIKDSSDFLFCFVCFSCLVSEWRARDNMENKQLW